MLRVGFPPYEAHLQQTLEDGACTEALARGSDRRFAFATALLFSWDVQDDGHPDDQLSVDEEQMIRDAEMVRTGWKVLQEHLPKNRGGHQFSARLRYSVAALRTERTPKPSIFDWQALSPTTDCMLLFFARKPFATLKQLVNMHTRDADRFYRYTIGLC